MLLVKKFNFFIHLFLVKKSLEKRFNNILDTKQTIFGHKKVYISQVPKIAFFWSKNSIVLSICFRSKIILEKRFNNVVDRKGTFFGHKKFNT